MFHNTVLMFTYEHVHRNAIIGGRGILIMDAYDFTRGSKCCPAIVSPSPAIVIPSPAIVIPSPAIVSPSPAIVS